MYRTLSVIAGILLSGLLLFSAALAQDEADLARIQAAIEAKGASWTAGDNPIFRLSREEQRRLCGAIIEPAESFQANARMHTPVRKDTPDALDWRDYEGINFITPIRDQAGCGSCVAFGTMASFEGRIQIFQNQPGTTLDLSEQHIFSCGGGFCDYGWSTSESHEYLLNEGAPLESCLPYQATDVDCEAVTCSDWQEQARKIIDWGNVPYPSPQAGVANIKTAVMEGPVACSYTVYDDFFSYNGGVYVQTTDVVAGGHCVSIVGWSDADSCWICKNSWGPWWGEDGYFRIRMGTNETTIEEWVHWMVPSGGVTACVKMAGLETGDAAGNGDGIPDPGETLDLTVTLTNLPTWGTLTDISGWLLSNDPRATVAQAMAWYPDSLPGGGTVTNSEDPFAVALAEALAIAPLSFTLWVNGTCETGLPYSRELTFQLPVTLAQTGWPVASDRSVRCSPAMLWHRGGPRRLAAVDDAGTLHLWSADGREAAGFPFSAPGGGMWGSLSLADLDGDGREEILFGSRNDTLYAVDQYGAVFFKRDLGADIMATPAVADLDGDGCLDMAVGSTDGKLYAVSGQTGQILEGFPFATGGPISSSPVAADLDGDGTREIICGSDDGHVYAVSADGTVLFDRQTGAAVRSSPAIADLDGDGVLNVIVTSQDNRIYALDPQGHCFGQWPYDTGTVLWSSPIVVDIDGDGALEVVVETPGMELLHVDTDGTLLLTQPIESEGIAMSSPVAGDLDNDGDLEIAVGTVEGLSVWNYPTPDTAPMPWPMYRGNPRRTGCPDDVLTGRAESSPAAALPAGYALLQNYPNPFNPQTTICYRLARTGPARLQIYNIAGQRIITLVDGMRPAGEHAAIWDGRDRAGRAISAGIYFCRLQAGEFSETKKMVLLK